MNHLQKREPWEDEKREPDMEKYVWEGSVSQKNLQAIAERSPGMKLDPEAVRQYAQAIERFHNEGTKDKIYFFIFKCLLKFLIFVLGEDVDKLNEYKQSVKRLLGLKY